jgi:CelD/BcsL family acetyltransferase involved in cellulose biosynthesis
MGHHAHTLSLSTERPFPRADVLPRLAGEARTEASDHALAAFAEWRPFGALADVADEWQDLAARAAEPNIFYEPGFALPAAAVFGRDAGAILIWSDAQPARLIGFFPARIERRRYGIGPAVLAGWMHPYAPLGVPLIDADHVATATRAWLDFIAAPGGLPSLTLIPYLPIHGPFALALQAELSARGGRVVAFDCHERALLAPAIDRATYLQAAMSAKRRKELRRQWRRLGEEHTVSFERATEIADVSVQLASFLEIESRGWKGSAGTAAAKNPAIREFMQRALANLAARSQVRIEQLILDGQPIAAGIVLRSGDTGWFWKTAYDETVARASPGVHLSVELTQSLLADASLAQVDSCATPDHTMIDHIWRERLTIADCLIAPGPDAVRSLPWACRLEHARRAAIVAAKWVRRRVRGR